MNQILVAGNKNGGNNKPTDIKKIIIFFSIAIIIFGVFLIVNGVVQLNKNPNNPQVGDITPTPQTSPTSDIPTEDKQSPVIELLLSGEKIRIVATDETEIAYIEYSWNDEEPKKVEAKNEATKIEANVDIKQGTNTLKVIAVDKNENKQEKTQTFQGKIKPEVTLFINTEKNGVIITATCADGIKKLEYTLNGKWVRIPVGEISHTKEQWAQVGVIVEYSEDGKITKVQYTQKLVEGENHFNVYAYSSEGLVGVGSGDTTYPM